MSLSISARCECCQEWLAPPDEEVVVRCRACADGMEGPTLERIEEAFWAAHKCRPGSHAQTMAEKRWEDMRAALEEPPHEK